MGNCDIGLIGLAVMGQNLVLNMSDHGFKAAVFNRTTEKVDEFLSASAIGRDILGVHSISEFAGLLKKPRKIMLMIKAGQAVDEILESLIPLLSEGDVIMDGGNSYFKDSIRRYETLKKNGIHFLGVGISGGEIGARRGPSIMPGGAQEAWPLVKPILQEISAKVDGDIPCCQWMSSDGSGHYVKMVHNGIEYGCMQLIAEIFHMLKNLLHLDYRQMADVFKSWNQNKLSSYLVEITANILLEMDTDGTPLVEKILDAAGQKGTGRWSSESALELGIPLTLVSEAVFARMLSARKDERVIAASELPAAVDSVPVDQQDLVAHLENALYQAEIISYAQGFMLLREAAKAYHWDLPYSGIANIWRNGCIIRSALLAHIRSAYSRSGDLENLLFDPYFKEQTKDNLPGLRKVVSLAAQTGIPVPAHASALAFYDGYRSASLPANLIQAQRDYFGSHTYERTDAPRGEFFHTNWSEEGGDVTASTYSA
jgi:6-phosphogluconate dehydrogenase